MPLMQSFDIVARGHANPKMTRLLNDIRTDVETGTSLTGLPQAPALLRRAVLQPGRGRRSGRYSGNPARSPGDLPGKDDGDQEQDQVGADLPGRVMVVAFVVAAVIMIFVIPAFKDVFKTFGADLPAPTLVVIAMSEFFVEYWYIDLRLSSAAIYFFMQSWRRSVKMQQYMDRTAAEAAGVRRDGQQGVDRALDAHAVDDVRRRRAAGRGARLGRRRLGQRGVRRGHRRRSRRRSTSAPPDDVDADHRRVPEDGAADGAIGEESGSLDAMLARPPSSTRTRSTRPSRGCRA